MGTTAGLAEDGDGGYAGAFYQIPIGARPTALGGAYIAISDDGAAPLFNPAGIATVERKLFGTSYRVMDLDRQLGYATFLLPTRERSVLGFNFHYFGVGDIQRRDSDGRVLAGDELSFNNFVGSAMFAKQFEEYLSLGLKASYMQASFAEMTAFSVGIDFGMMLYVDNMMDRDKRMDMSIRDIRLGLVIKNLAATYRWDSGEYNDVFGSGGQLGVEQEDDVPIEVGLGGSARFFDRRLLLAADVYKNIEQNPRLHTGAEFLITPEFALRGGYSDKRLTAGTGYLFKIKNQLLAIDYAFATDRVDEGSEHIFSFDLIF